MTSERENVRGKKPTCLHAQLLRHYARIMHIKPNKEVSTSHICII